MNHEYVSDEKKYFWAFVDESQFDISNNNFRINNFFVPLSPNIKSKFYYYVSDNHEMWEQIRTMGSENEKKYSRIIKIFPILSFFARFDDGFCYRQ